MAQASTSVFFVLCALASVSIALAAYCVDLTTGKTSVLPGNTGVVKWNKKPTSNGGRCNLQGVLKIKPPTWAKTLSYKMVFENSSNWSFNIGDSPYNYGDGDAIGRIANTVNAEIHSYNNYLKAYRSILKRSSLITSTPSVKTALLIRLSAMKMYVTNYEGFNYYKEDGGLFAFNTMYMGLNRVVKYSKGPPMASRTGRGLCSVCISFLTESVSDLHKVHI